MDGSPGYRRRRWGRRFGQDLKKFKINFPTCLGKLLKQNHHPANLSCSFSSQWRKNSGELKNSPPNAKDSRKSLVRAKYHGLLRRVAARSSHGRNDGVQEGHNSPGAESLWGRWITAGSPKSPNNVTSTFFSAVHLLPKDLSFAHGGAKLASCLGRHLTSLRP